MNWRGRPLISHDVIVNSIVATTTGTGLRVEAELDTGTYDTGIKVTDAEIDALPMHRHRFHGDWNYTLRSGHPQPVPGKGPEASAPTTTAQRTAQRVTPGQLSDPELTGMTGTQLNSLVSELTPALQAEHELGRYRQRGGERRRAPGAGAKPKLSAADRILATVLYQRKVGTQDLIGRLFAVDRSTITGAVNEVRPVLERHGHHITASTARFRTPADVINYLTPRATDPTHADIQSAC